MNSTQLAAAAGIVLSLLFEHVPGIRDWFAGLGNEYKRLFMVALLLSVTLSIFGLSCVGPYDWAECSQAGAWALIEAFVAAIVTNQVTHRIAKR